jgi:hypothetical protein
VHINEAYKRAKMQKKIAEKHGAIRAIIEVGRVSTGQGSLG